MATDIQQSGRLVALDQIRVPENVRALDAAHVHALAGSIALQGILVPRAGPREHNHDRPRTHVGDPACRRGPRLLE